MKKLNTKRHHPYPALFVAVVVFFLASVTELANEFWSQPAFAQTSVAKEQSSRPFSTRKITPEALDTLLKQEEFNKTKHSLSIERLQAYQNITSLVEQKLGILKNTNISFEELNAETRKAQTEIERLKERKKNLAARVEQLSREVKFLEQDIWARTSILGLQEHTQPDDFQDTLINQQNNLQLVHSQISQLQKQDELAEVQLNIYKDYAQIIHNKRWKQFQNALFAPHKYVLSRQDKVLLLFLTAFFILGFLFRKKTEAFFKRLKVGVTSLVYLFRVGLASGFFFLAAYYIVLFFGYQFLAHYIIEKILLSIVIAGVFIFGYRLFNAFMAFILFHTVEGELQQDVPFFTMLKGIVWLGTFVAITMVILNIWGVDSGHYVFLLEWSRKPFVSFGSVHISVLVIVQFVILIWTFNFLSHVLNKFLDKNIYPRTRLDESAQYSISIAIKYLFIFVGVIMGLRVLGFELATLTVLAGTIGIGIGFGLQEIAKNFISGIIMLVERPVKVGDWIEIGDLPGQVQAIKARGTVIQTVDNISVVVPNSEFITKQVINWSYSDKVIRLKLPVGVVYGSDVDLVRESLLEVARQNTKILKHPEPYVVFNDFGDNALGFYLYVWTDDAKTRFKLLSELHFAVNKLFQERNLVIAFPQRDIHLKTSDVVFEVKRKDKVK